MAQEKRISTDHECIDPVLEERREGVIEIALRAGAPNFELQSGRGGCCLHVLRLRRGIWVIRIHEQPDRGNFGHEFAQQFQPLRPQLDGEKSRAGDVPTRPVQTDDQASLNWIASYCEYDWNGGRLHLSRECRGDRTCEEYSYSQAN